MFFLFPFSSNFFFKGSMADQQQQEISISQVMKSSSVNILVWKACNDGRSEWLYKTSLYEEACMTSSLFRTNTKTFWLICQVCVSLWSPRWVFVSNSLLIFLTMIEIGFVSFLYGYEFLKPRRWQRQILLSSFSASVQNIQHNSKLHILWRTDNPPVLLMVVCWKINQSSIRSMFI